MELFTEFQRLKKTYGISSEEAQAAARTLRTTFDASPRRVQAGWLVTSIGWEVKEMFRWA